MNIKYPNETPNLLIHLVVFIDLVVLIKSQPIHNKNNSSSLEKCVFRGIILKETSRVSILPETKMGSQHSV